MARNLPKNLAHGQAGVYRVASELLLRGYTPCLPIVDIGADLMLQEGLRIQVKTASLRKSKPYPNGAYWFKLGRTERVKNTQIFRTGRIFSEECDFVVLFGIDESRFWVVPTNLMDNHQCVVVGPKIHIITRLDMPTTSSLIRPCEDGWDKIQEVISSTKTELEYNIDNVVMFKQQVNN